MANLTRQELIEEIDWERRENNSKFVSRDAIIRLLRRAVKRILREPGIRTVEAVQNITASGSTSSYDLEDDFKEVISIWSGEGVNNGVQFHYSAVDEYAGYEYAYKYTFLEKGKIDIKFPDVGSLPSQTIKHRYWTKNIVEDENGLPKTAFTEETDISRLGEEFDEFYIDFCTALILRREGKKEWRDRMDLAEQTLMMLKEQPGTKTRRPRKSFGFMQ